MIRGRLDAGTASALDVAQQDALVAGERANIPNLRNQLEQELIGLGILVGRPPEAINVRPGSLDTSVVAAGLRLACHPSLLARRPDVAEAEAQLVAANFNIRRRVRRSFRRSSSPGQTGYQAAALTSAVRPWRLLSSRSPPD